MFPWGAAAYALVSVLACVGSWLWLGRLPFSIPNPWLNLGPVGAHLYSALLGAAFGATLVLASRMSLPRFQWARRLHEEFRPVAQDLSSGAILCLAVLSSAGEELLFRGLAQPFLGLILQAVVFGLLHQMPGPSRWIWVTWASLVGLGQGIIFQLTGSLVGPLLAHGLVNGLNLAYLKHHDPNPPRSPLGGLLGRN
jgi:membrane protease YdiL (CAAX protease family)